MKERIYEMKESEKNVGQKKLMINYNCKERVEKEIG